MATIRINDGGKGLMITVMWGPERVQDSEHQCYDFING